MSFVEKNNDYQSDDFYSDEVKTDNSPLKKGGSSFKTKDIVFENGFAYTEPSTSAKIFQWGFFLLGDALILFGFLFYFFEGGKEALIPFLAVGVIFSLIGFSMMKFTKKIYFDKSINVYHDGKGYDPMMTKSDYKKQGKLKDIKALQIIKEKVKTKDSSFYSYEINIVLKTGERLNVVDHGNLKEIKRQTRELETFLGVKVLNSEILNGVEDGSNTHFKI